MGQGAVVDGDDLRGVALDVHGIRYLAVSLFGIRLSTRYCKPHDCPMHCKA